MKEGKHQKGLILEETEYSPGVKLLCDWSDGKKARPIVPPDWRVPIIKKYHQLNHPGQKGTLQKVERSYYWPELRNDVAKFVAECHDCQAVKSQKTIQPPVKQRPVIDERFKSIQVDVVGPLPVSEGMRYLFTVWDTRTRWMEALPMSEASAVACAQALIRGWISRIGIPRMVLSDNGNTFIAEVWQEFHKQLGPEVAYTPPTMLVLWEGWRDSIGT